VLCAFYESTTLKVGTGNSTLFQCCGDNDWRGNVLVVHGSIWSRSNGMRSLWLCFPSFYICTV